MYAHAFATVKRAVKAIQVLSVIDPSRPCKLDVHVTETVMVGTSGSGSNELLNLLDSGCNSGKEQISGTP